MERTVTTTGVGTASAVPDAVALTVAVRHQADSVADALAGCASAVEVLVATARRFTDEDKVATCGFDVDRWHDRNGEPAGYAATHTLSVLCPGFDEAGDLLIALADDVGDRFAVHGVRRTLTDTAALERQAREAAFAHARQKAQELAALAGQRVVEAVRVVEGGGETPFGGRTEMLSARAAGGTRFEPGTTDVSAAVTVTWRTETA
jgi:hypothetical protein